MDAGLIGGLCHLAAESVQLADEVALACAKEKSSVFISHRLSSTRFCDRILLIENGQIKEEGTHTTLMQKGGTYAELFEMQSSYYCEKEAGTDGRDAE